MRIFLPQGVHETKSFTLISLLVLTITDNKSFRIKIGNNIFHAIEESLEMYDVWRGTKNTYESAFFFRITENVSNC